MRKWIAAENKMKVEVNTVRVRESLKGMENLGSLRLPVEGRGKRRTQERRPSSSLIFVLHLDLRLQANEDDDEKTGDVFVPTTQFVRSYVGSP